MHSTYPLRQDFQTEVGPWEQAGRFLRGFVQCQQLEIQVCTIYGFPSSVTQSKQRTNELLTHAIHQAALTSMPTIFAGDLNHPVDNLQVMTQLRAQGYRTIQDIYLERTGHNLDPTFGTSTSNDTAILSPQLCALVQDIWVDNDKWLSGHNPLCFTMDIPSKGLHHMQWKLPQSWLPLEPDAEEVAKHYHSSPWMNSQHPGLHPLQAWAVSTEQAVHHALKVQHAKDPVRWPVNGLPRAYRGRCQPRKLVQVPQARTIKTACNGQYQPTFDQASMPMRHWVRQLRRVQSLGYRLKQQPLKPDKHPPDVLQHEWNVVLEAPGFCGNFTTWLTSHPELSPVPASLPTQEYLYDVQQFLKLAVDDRATRANKVAHDMAKFRMSQDIKKYGKKSAFKQIKETSPGILQQVSAETMVPADVIGDYQYGLLTVRSGQFNQVAFDLDKPVTVVNQLMQIIDLTADTMELLMDDPAVALPARVEVRQKRHTVTPQIIADELTQHWNQYWQRDTPDEQEDLHAWTSFLGHKQLLTVVHQVDQDYSQPELWDTALKSMRPNTSRGICGWAPDELKQLPNLREGFPEWLMKAQVLPLEKQPQTTDVFRTRPITITSLLYRFWSKAVVRKLLHQWTHWMPPSICGFLPRRGPLDWHYAMQLELEATNLGYQTTHHGGLTLDLKKCFNCLPQAPVVDLLVHLGLPDEIAYTWTCSIRNLTRYWQLGDTMHLAGVPTTGYPEGDPLAVAAMVAVNWYMIQLLAPIVPQITAFADNWSYSFPEPRCHNPAIRKLVEVTDAMRLSIDWQKTWGWGTNKAHQSALKAAKQTATQDQLQLSLVKHARELGYVARYRLAPYRAPQKVRRNLAIRRLKKLSIVDPEFWTIREAIKQARNFVHQASHAQKQKFYHIASRPNKKIQHAIGPASALSVYLSKLAWSITATGELHSFAFCSLHLEQSNLQDILSLAEYAWMQKVSVEASSRKGLKHMPAIDRHATHRVLAQAPEGSHLTLGLQITNGFMFGQQKSKFVPEATEQCALCPSTDGHRRQVLECPATQAARQPFAQLCQELDEQDPIHLAVPVVFHSPHFEWLTVLAQAFPEPVLQLPANQPTSIFTDAACSQPAATVGRLVTYSIVILRPDRPSVPPRGPADLDQYCDTLAVAHVTGSQTVPRGELLASVKAHEAGIRAVVVTDSDYVIKSHQAVRSEPTLARLCNKTNFDLLARLHSLHWQQGHPILVRKVKSHQEFPPVDDPNYEDILGNWGADLAATLAHRALNPTVIAEFTQQAKDNTQQRAQVLQQYQLRHELSKHRVRLLQTEEPVADVDGRFEQLRNWQVHDPWTFGPPEEELALVQASKYGAKYTSLLLRWLATLEWPQLDLAAFSFTNQTTAFSNSVQHLQYLVDRPVYPPQTTQHVKSLSILQSGVFKKGFPRRPAMKQQEQTVDLVRAYCLRYQQDGKTRFECQPDIPRQSALVSTDITNPSEDRLQDRMTRYHQFRATLRTSRRPQMDAS
eukprot:Skav225533  [mRNA]  locus=scaffold144:568552:573362:- [translate_table: standard]